MRTNNHLKSKIKDINNFMANNTEPPKDLFDAFVMELGVSKLLIPAVEDDEGVELEHLESDDGLTILPLYTDDEAYDDDKMLLGHHFAFYAEVVKDCEFDGAVINMGTDDMFVPANIMLPLSRGYDDFINDDDIYDPEELREIAFSIKNEELVRFIENESNFNKFSELAEKLSRATLLNVVSGPMDLGELDHDGIVSALAVGGFDLSVKTEGKEKYGLLFTSFDKIESTCDVNAGVNYLVQISSLEKILNYILGNDLDGVILNPFIDDYYIPRNVLVDLYYNHPEAVNDRKYLQGNFFAFTV